MDNQSEHNQKNTEGFLFNVEILVKSESNAKALQALLQMLNHGNDIIDYKINSGIELGQIIDAMLTAKKQTIISKSYKRLAEPDKTNKPATAPSDKAKPSAKSEAEKPKSFEDIASSDDFERWIQKYIAGNRLVRLLVNRNGERVSLPCRVLNFLPETYTINVYHVDEKQVYTFKLSEIIDFIEN